MNIQRKIEKEVIRRKQLQGRLSRALGLPCDSNRGVHFKIGYATQVGIENIADEKTDIMPF